jgi:hypothetical protein
MVLYALGNRVTRSLHGINCHKDLKALEALARVLKQCHGVKKGCM